MGVVLCRLVVTLSVYVILLGIFGGENIMFKKLVLFSLFLLFMVSLSGTVSAANWTVGSNGTYQSIHEAINSNNTGENDTIIVNPKSNGSYNENLYINKPKINLIANGSVTINASNYNLPTVTIWYGGSGSTVTGFNIIGGSTGIVTYADNCQIIGNNITIGNPGSDYSNGVDSGYTIDGGIAVESSNVLIKGNKINGNRDNVKGIMLVVSDCTVTENNIINAAFGILFGGAYGCNVTGNTINGCYYGIDVECNDYYFASENCQITGNNITNSYMHGIRISGLDGDENVIKNIKITGNTITHNGNGSEQTGGGIYLNHDTSNINISGNNITGNWNGIEFGNMNEISGFQPQEGNIITGNTITGNSFWGIGLTNINGTNIISNNTITNNTEGINLYNTIWTLITENTIKDNSGSGINLNNSNNNTIQSNNVRNNQYGIYLSDSSANVNFNVIIENSVYGLYNKGNGVVNAINNWWGSNANPIISSTSGSDIYMVNGTITYNPWLILNNTASSTSTNGNSTVTADLTHNSNGEDTSSQGHIPDNLPVDFATNVGTIISPAYTRNGKASTTFNCGTATSGTLTIIATLDKQTVQANFIIDTIMPTVTANLAGGIYNTTKTVTLNATDNLDPDPIIYYSVDNGSTWNNHARNVTLNLNPGKTDLKFYVRDAAGNTCVTQTVIYIIDTTAPIVTLNPVGGLYNTTKSVTLNVTDNLDPNPIIYYTINGTNPTTSSTKYVGPINITTTTTLKFIAVDFAGNTCPIQVATYTIDTIAPTVTASLANGTYTTYQKVTLTVTDNLDKNPVIYYTLDGTTPTTSSTRYTVPINIVKNNTTLKFMATDAAGNKAQVQTRTYKINLPVININTGKVYSTIKNAINDSLTINSHTLEIKSGTYKENIVINKKLTLRPISGGSVTLQPASVMSDVIYIISGGNGTTIQGFTIRGNEGGGININGASNCNIIGNNITGCTDGIYIYSGSNYNIIQNNTIKNCGIDGICLSGSNYNIIRNNKVTSNYMYGISLGSSNYNTIQNNTVANNIEEDLGEGISLSSSNNNIIQGNAITNNYMHGIFMGQCLNNNVLSNTITNNGYGIYLTSSSANINFNRITGNRYIGIKNWMGSGMVNATNNWWGHNTAPTRGSNYGNDYYSDGGTFIVGPWLVLKVTASPTSTNSNSTITVDLTHNSNGEDTSSLGRVPNNISVSLTTNKGTIASSAYIKSGKASAIFNRGTSTPGTATIKITVDKQTVQVNVTIIA